PRAEGRGRHNASKPLTGSPPPRHRPPRCHRRVGSIKSRSSRRRNRDRAGRDTLRFSGPQERRKWNVKSEGGEYDVRNGFRATLGGDASGANQCHGTVENSAKISIGAAGTRSSTRSVMPPDLQPTSDRSETAPRGSPVSVVLLGILVARDDLIKCTF